MRTEKGCWTQKDKNSPVYWSDPNIGVNEVRAYPANFRFSCDPKPCFFHNKPHWLVGSLDIKIGDSIEQGVILVSDDENHTILSMQRAYWKENEHVDYLARDKSKRVKQAEKPSESRAEQRELPLATKQEPKQKERPKSPSQPIQPRPVVVYTFGPRHH